MIERLAAGWLSRRLRLRLDELTAGATRPQALPSGHGHMLKINASRTPRAE
jgi:hypothetical protein